ncbi:hypothetical protein NPIL_525071 [Nephila pilipes]|uniref:Uncharacterized protein n=1 Tax=Nephila pilipes TaxID=299642 RepID=A0A8X6PR24_NEPPI|nr:hypothetical protein NPIL_525071 [Nephila pilipes]
MKLIPLQIICLKETSPLKRLLYIPKEGSSHWPVTNPPQGWLIPLKRLLELKEGSFNLDVTITPQWLINGETIYYASKKAPPIDVTITPQGWLIPLKGLR